MDNLIKWGIGLAVAVAAVLLLFALFRIRRWWETRSLLAAEPRRSVLPLRLLLCNFSAGNLFRSIRLPVGDAPGSPTFTTDILMVHRGGILLLTVRDLHGKIDNPYRGDWRQLSGDQVTQLKNPVERGAMNCRALTNLLLRENVSNVPIRHFTVYLDPRVRMKNRMDQVILVDRLIPLVRDMRREKFLSRLEIRLVKAILRQKRLPEPKRSSSAGKTSK